MSPCYNSCLIFLDELFSIIRKWTGQSFFSFHCLYLDSLWCNGDKQLCCQGNIGPFSSIAHFQLPHTNFQLVWSCLDFLFGVQPNLAYTHFSVAIDKFFLHCHNWFNSFSKSSMLSLLLMVAGIIQQWIVYKEVLNLFGFCLIHKRRRAYAALKKGNLSPFFVPYTPKDTILICSGWMTATLGRPKSYRFASLMAELHQTFYLLIVLSVSVSTTQKLAVAWRVLACLLSLLKTWPLMFARDKNPFDFNSPKIDRAKFCSTSRNFTPGASGLLRESRDQRCWSLPHFSLWNSFPPFPLFFSPPKSSQQVSFSGLQDFLGAGRESGKANNRERELSWTLTSVFHICGFWWWWWLNSQTVKCSIMSHHPSK